VCTLTWLESHGGYQLFFNRDERRSRLPAAEPEPALSGATRYVAPLDGDRGGTWIAVSEHGLAACLLNGFVSIGEPPPVTRGAYETRGLLVPAVIESSSVPAALQHLETLDLARFQPFMLVLFEPDHRPTLAHWDGSRLEIGDEALTKQPLVSSSFYTEEVRSLRTATLHRFLDRPGSGDKTERHLAYHRSHHPSRGPYSPCMHREDARTVSFSWVAVDRERIRFRYTPGPPCRGLRRSPAVSLSRA
jgi:hypothetical protein